MYVIVATVNKNDTGLYGMEKKYRVYIISFRNPEMKPIPGGNWSQDEITHVNRP